MLEGKSLAVLQVHLIFKKLNSGCFNGCIRGRERGGGGGGRKKRKKKTLKGVREKKDKCVPGSIGMRHYAVGSGPSAGAVTKDQHVADRVPLSLISRCASLGTL